MHGPYLPRTTYEISTQMYLTAPTHRGDIAGLALDLTQEQSQLHAVLQGRVIPAADEPVLARAAVRRRRQGAAARL